MLPFAPSYAGTVFNSGHPMKFYFSLLPIVAFGVLLPLSAQAQPHTAEPLLIAGQELRNTCENETESYYDPFAGRVVTRTELVCRPRLVQERPTRSSGSSNRSRSVAPGRCPNILQIARNSPYRLVREQAMDIYRRDCAEGN
jgi:hypothetical protein